MIKRLFRNELFWLLVIISLVFTYFFRRKPDENILILIPALIGVIFSGVISCTTIILTLISKEEFEIILEYDAEKSFRNLMNTIKSHCLLMLIVLFLSVVVLLVPSVAPFDKIPEQILKDVHRWQLLVFSMFVLLGVSLLSAWDVVNSIFDIEEIKREAVKKSLKCKNPSRKVFLT